MDGAEKANLLAEKIRTVTGGAARTKLPEPRTPVLLLGIPDWAEPDEIVYQWMSANGLTLAPEKSECVIITKKHSFDSPQLRYEASRYLSIEPLDTRIH